MSAAGMSAAGHPSLRRLVCVSFNPAVDKIVAVDHLVAGAIHRPDVLSMVPGGKALNVGRAATSLGVDVVVVAVLGGYTGVWIREALRAVGVAVRVVEAPGETRTCTSVLDRSTGTLTELYERGTSLDAAVLGAVEEAVGAELDTDATGTVVAVSGSLPPGAPDTAYARIVALTRARGARAAIDASGRPLVDAVVQRPWLVKVNAREAADATGLTGQDEATVIRAATALQASGATNVLLTRGVEGALLLDASGMAWRIGPPPERGSFPVGSGDSVLAGLMAGIAAGDAMEEAARRGAAAGAANALHPGQGRIDPHDLARLLPLVHVSRIVR